MQAISRCDRHRSWHAMRDAVAKQADGPRQSPSMRTLTVQASPPSSSVAHVTGGASDGYLNNARDAVRLARLCGHGHAHAPRHARSRAHRATPSGIESERSAFARRTGAGRRRRVGMPGESTIGVVKRIPIGGAARNGGSSDAPLCWLALMRLWGVGMPRALLCRRCGSRLAVRRAPSFLSLWASLSLAGAHWATATLGALPELLVACSRRRFGVHRGAIFAALIDTR